MAKGATERQCGRGGAEVGLSWGDVCAGWPHRPPRSWNVIEDTVEQPERGEKPISKAIVKVSSMSKKRSKGEDF